MTAPAVTVVIPVLDEAASIGDTLAAVGSQRYDGVVEVLVVDGGSTDGTVAIASTFAGVRVLTNPDRIQSAAMNQGLRRASGDVIVRLDGHCAPAPDYIARCVEALERTGAAMVGGSMRADAQGWPGAGIAAAMGSRLGAGPALFHRTDAEGWVDTVWLGAFRRSDAVAVGGYDDTLPVNEDADFARRLALRGGIWLDRSIVCRYRPRSSFRALARQFHRYGRGRATTVRADPGGCSPRHLAAPALLVALLTPARLPVAAAYVAVVAARSAAVPGGAGRRTGYALAVPTMHLSWGTGFLIGLVRPLRTQPIRPAPEAEVMTGPPAAPPARSRRRATRAAPSAVGARSPRWRW